MYKQITCVCDGWWFPHRWGCKGCRHREEFIIDRSLREVDNLADDTDYWRDIDDSREC